MKKLLIALFFCMVVFPGHSQNNLQFSQVLTYSGTLSFGTVNVSPVWSVPAGKVWKIESMTTNQQFVAAIGNERMYFKLNDVSIKQYFSGLSTAYPTMIENLSPLWLKAGDFVQFTSNVNNASGYSCNYYLSIVEFNLAP
ncbi:MAG: hypothetical protein QM737_22060 [Ferruginibacter sp.]